MYCARCKEPVEEGKLVCQNCGAVLAIQDPAEQVAPEPEPPAKKSKVGLIVGIVVVCILAVIAGVVAYNLIQNQQDEVQTESDRAHSTHLVPVSISIEGYDSSTDTRIPIDVVGTDYEGNSVAETYYIFPEDGGLELVAGEYDVSFSASPLTASAAFYTVPEDVCHVSIASDLATGEALPEENTIAVTYTSIGVREVTEAAEDTAYDYAVRDNAYAQLAEDNKAKLDDAIEAAHRADTKAELAPKLQKIDTDLVAAFGQRNADGTFTLSEREATLSALWNYSEQYRTLSEEIAKALSAYDEKAVQTAQTENAALDNNALMASGGDVLNALNLHGIFVEENKWTFTGGDSITFSWQLLRYRELCSRYLSKF